MVSNIVILTGAGVSAESGVPTFRGADGLWENHRIEDVASPAGFARNPQLVHRFYNERRRRLRTLQPNAAHTALAEFEQQLNKEKQRLSLVTQNIDGLHSRAGSQKVLAMHGELEQGRCEKCQTIFAVQGDLSLQSVCSHCKKAGGLRPQVVWFGEIPLFMEQIMGALQTCDLFVAIGTSSEVYPAAGFVMAAKQAAAYCIELNLERTEMSAMYDECKQGKASVLVPDFLQKKDLLL